MTSAEYQKARLKNHPKIAEKLRIAAREKNRAKVLKKTGKPVKVYAERNK